MAALRRRGSQRNRWTGGPHSTGALQEWKEREDPDEREKPTRRRYRTGDATPEAVAQILEENPRGILLARDELGAWSDHSTDT